LDLLLQQENRMTLAVLVREHVQPLLQFPTLIDQRLLRRGHVPWRQRLQQSTDKSHHWGPPDTMDVAVLATAIARSVC
jgi:hypothetical protein